MGGAKVLGSHDVAGVELRTTRFQGFRLAEGIQGLVHCSPCSKKG